jgi:nicotinate-nucleotide adenylyltransferase
MSRPQIAIFGGTFDPIHMGHLAIAEGIRDRCGLDEVWFMPAGAPPHKVGRQQISPVQHRVNMVRLAIAGNPRFVCSTLEADEPGLSYTVDTVERLQAQFPDKRFCLITGTDAILHIETWKDYQRLLRLVPFLVATRPGYRRGSWLDLAARLGPDLTAQVTFVELPGLDIASSELRSMVGQGLSVRYLVPEAVFDYIESHGLYR